METVKLFGLYNELFSTIIAMKSKFQRNTIGRNNTNE